MIKDGQQNAFLREYGYKIFDYAERNVDYAGTFNQAMASYSAAHTTWVLEALEANNFSDVTHICDVGGGTWTPPCKFAYEVSPLEGNCVRLRTRN